MPLQIQSPRTEEFIRCRDLVFDHNFLQHGIGSLSEKVQHAILKNYYCPNPSCQEINLGRFVAEKLPEKEFAFYKGGCPRHIIVSAKDVEKAKKAHPDALLLVHPECRASVTEQADYAGSTTGIMNYAKESDCKEFIIGTENSIVQHLQFECPDKKFYLLSDRCVCHNMKITTLYDVYNALLGEGGEEIQLSAELILDAKRPIDRMIELGK